MTNVFSKPLNESVRDGNSLPTTTGGRLMFRSASVTWDPADGPKAVSVRSLAAFSGIPGRTGGDDMRVLNLRTALVDSDGNLWQRTRIIDVHEVWRHLLRDMSWRIHYKDWKADPQLARAGRVDRRVLVGPVDTLCDSRDDDMIEVIRPREGDGLAWKIAPYERCEKLLYRLRFKYFGMSLTVMEQVSARRLNSGTEQAMSQILFVMQSHVSIQAIVILDEKDNVLRQEKAELNRLGPLEIPVYSMSAQWSLPDWGPVEPASREEWDSALCAAGIDAAGNPALQANANIVLERG